MMTRRFLGTPAFVGLAAASVALIPHAAQAQNCDSFLIPVEGYGPGAGSVINFVYDPSRNYLFITRPQGTLDRYDAEARVMLPRWSVGTFPQGLDITPDGQSLIIAEEFRQAGFPGRVLRVDASTGVVAPIPLGPTGNWDVVVTADGRAFVTPVQAVTGSEQRLRELNLATSAWQVRLDVPFSNGQVRPQSTLARSPDRTRIFLQEAGVEPWNAAIYSAASNAFSLTPQRLAGAAFNHDASRMAVGWTGNAGAQETRIYDASGAIVATVPHVRSLASAFDPIRPRLYLTNRSTDELLTIDTQTWSVIARKTMPLDFDLALRAAITADGSLLFVQTAQGIGAIELGAALCRCAPDLTTSGAVVPGQVGFGLPDGVVNNDDFFYLLTLISFHYTCAPGTCPTPPDLTTTGAAAPGHPGFGVPDGTFNNDDFFYFLTVFAAGC